MSGTENSSNVISIHSGEADSILLNMRALRDQIVIAWRERGVMLTSEERHELHREIKQTCEFLGGLTRNP